MPERTSWSTGAVPDSLSTVLQDLRLSAAHYCQCEMAEPWGLDLPGRDEATVHFVLAGRCWLEPYSSEAVPLHAGDVVLLPRGTGHRLVSAPGGSARSLESLAPQQIGGTTFRLQTGGKGPKARLVCCGIIFEEPRIHPLLELMPPVLHVREARRDAMLRSLLRAMADELTRQRVGSATVITRLADIVVTHVVRSWIESHGRETRGWLAALQDPQIGRSLAAIHKAPSRDWSVTSLARIASLSRSVFSQRFASSVGMPPARYVARWRMHLATTFLRANQLTVGQVAERLGYSSESSFSRTFKRLMGTSPIAFRGGRIVRNSKRSVMDSPHHRGKNQHPHAVDDSSPVWVGLGPRRRAGPGRPDPF
jgi:AraC-like DNA-binding protein